MLLLRRGVPFVVDRPSFALTFFNPPVFSKYLLSALLSERISSFFELRVAGSEIMNDYFSLYCTVQCT
jgi:hypothetical protein